MQQERLESLMLMSIEDDLLEQLDVDKLVQLFVDMAPRRMGLVSIFKLNIFPIIVPFFQLVYCVSLSNKTFALFKMSN